METLENAAHGFIFAITTLAALEWLCSRDRPRPWSSRHYYWAALGISALFGAVTEIVQIPGPRSASIDDFILDMCGSLMALSWWSLRQLPHRLSVASVRHASVMTIALVTFCLPLAEAAFAYHQRTAGFPALMAFNAPSSTYFLSGEAVWKREKLPSPWLKRPGEMALRVDLPHTRWPRINLVEPYPDWSRYSNISLDIVNPTTIALDLTLRIEDAAHDGQYTDRFNTLITIPPSQRRQITIPLESIASAPHTRRMDLQHMTRLSIYRDQPADAGTIYIVGARLQ